MENEEKVRNMMKNQGKVMENDEKLRKIMKNQRKILENEEKVRKNEGKPMKNQGKVMENKEKVRKPCPRPKKNKIPKTRKKKFPKKFRTRFHSFDQLEIQLSHAVLESRELPWFGWQRYSNGSTSWPLWVALCAQLVCCG